MSDWNEVEGDDPRPVAESLERVSRGLSGAAASGLATLFTHWADLVGPQIAAHARPVRLSGGTLVVAADQPIWRTQLAYFEADLVARVTEVLGPGAVQRITVVVRPG